MLSSTPPLFSKSRLAGDFGVRAVFVSLTYAKYATLPQKLLCLKIPQPYDFFGDAHEAIWLVNFALPSKGFASFTPSKLRLAFHHEAQNFLNHMTS